MGWLGWLDVVGFRWILGACRGRLAGRRCLRLARLGGWPGCLVSITVRPRPVLTSYPRIPSPRRCCLPVSVVSSTRFGQSSALADLVTSCGPACPSPPFRLMHSGLTALLDTGLGARNRPFLTHVPFI